MTFVIFQNSIQMIPIRKSHQLKKLFFPLQRCFYNIEKLNEKWGEFPFRKSQPVSSWVSILFIWSFWLSWLSCSSWIFCFVFFYVWSSFVIQQKELKIIFDIIIFYKRLKYVFSVLIPLSYSFKFIFWEKSLIFIFLLQETHQ